MPLTTLVARDLSVSRGPIPILRNVSLTLGPNDRIGLIGRNGAGKTTLLRALAGLDAGDRDDGIVERLPADASVGYLAQEPDRSIDETVADFLARRTGVASAQRALDAATQALADSAAGADDAYTEALDRWMRLGGADLDHRAPSVLADVGMHDGLLDQPTGTLSGGQAARAQLAGLLLARHDVLLLDEPTNDLDFEALEMLEAFVIGLDRPLMVVSHDRAFLDRTITAVVEIDDHLRTASRFEGGWSAYLEESAIARRHAEADHAEFLSKRERLQTRARQQRDWAVQGVRDAKRKAPDGDKYIRHFNTASSEKQAAKAKATERAIQRLDVVEKPWEGWQLHLQFAEAERSGAVVARLTDAVVDQGDFRLGPVSVEVGWGDRVAILGPNGSGKSTLLGALLGERPLSGGTQHLGRAVIVNGLDQARSVLQHDRPMIDLVSSAINDQPKADDVQEARSLLAKFDLDAEDVARPGHLLSPGERTRAMLAILAGRRANCLVLDEPTNHLDLDAIVALEGALEQFSGTVLLVSHDRRLLDEISVTRRIHVDGGHVTQSG